MTSIQFLISTVFGIYSFILLLRAWFQFARVDFYNPLSQTIVKLTQPVLAPLRKIAPTIKNIDTASLLAIFILAVLKFPLLNLFGAVVAVSEPLIYLFIGLLSLVHTVGEGIFYVLFAGAILSWFDRGNSPFQYVLYQLTEPLLAPIRRILPRTGMIDFSPMVIILILFFINRFLYDIFGNFWAIATL